MTMKAVLNMQVEEMQDQNEAWQYSRLILIFNAIL